jgi:WD40 repeat protein
MSPVGSGPVEIFLSYSRRDEHLLHELEVHLAALKREGRVASWTDRKLVAGEEWHPELMRRLESAPILLLLLSPDFIASDFCWRDEMTTALARHRAGTAKVIPIVLRPCDWNNTPLAALQALPKDGLPISRWHDKDEAFLDVVQGIRKALAAPAKVAPPPARKEPSPPPAPVDRPVPVTKTPPKGAMLRLELGMHSASITRIDVDPAERFLVTSSDDKTVRIWDLRDGELLRVLRPPVGPGDEGKIYCVAISPDTSLIAAGGWTLPDGEEQIYLFDRATGRLVRRLEGLPSVANHLTFSNDGSRIAVVLGGTGGVRIFRSADGRLLLQEPAGDDCYGAAFASDSRLATTSHDGFLRLFSAEPRLLTKTKAPGGQEPFDVAFSPGGQQLAVGFSDSSLVDVFSAQELKFLFTLNSPATNGDLSSVAWSSDGQKLFAAGRYDKNGWSPILSFGENGRGKATELPGPASTIMSLRALRGDRLVYGAADPAWALLASGKVQIEKTPAQADFRDLRGVFCTSASGREIAFAFERGKKGALFSLAKRELELAATPSRFDGPRTEASGLEIHGWKNEAQPRLNDRVLELQTRERSRSLAIAADGRNFLLGADWSLRLYRSDGEPIWEKAIPEIAWAVNLTRDGRLALAAFGDGTIRWFRVSDGEELLAFFPHIDAKRWVLWTPGGYYDASPGGEDLIGWHVNRGPDQAADFYPAAKFRHHFHRPEVIDRILDTLDEAEALRLAE